MKSGFETKAGNEPAGGKPVFVPPAVEEMSRLFPQLEIIELLGQGGMGAVYKARQPRLNRFVALKILSPEKQNDPQFAERFEREARALAWLTHPHIVTVYDFGEVQGHFYLLMEFVDGLTLRQLFQARKLSPAEALNIVPKICEALQYAHEQGVIHRDIKPENILLDKKSQVKIADFGIAKILDLGPGDLSLTGAKDVVGTPHYMAPEQIEKPQAVDGRADIYSRGVVFYEMLTGELPLGKFQPPSQKVKIDVRLDEVVLRALEKEPDRRYQQVSEVKTDVEKIARTTSMPANARLSSQAIPAGDYTLDIGRCLRRGWALVRSDFLPVVGITALILLLRQAANLTLIGYVASGPLMGGLWLYYLKKIRGEPAGVATTFSGFSIAFFQLFLAAFVTLVLVIIGFFCLILPGIYLTVAWTFTLALVIDKRLGFGPAMKLGRKTISRHWWNFFGFMIVLWLLNLAGLLLFFVGSLVTIPVTMAALAYAYEEIFCPAERVLNRPPTEAQPATIPPASQSSRRPWIFATGAATVLVAGVAFVWWLKSESKTPTRSNPTPDVSRQVTGPSAPKAAVSVPVNGQETKAESWKQLLNEDQRLVAQWTDDRFRDLFDARTFDGWSNQERANLERRSLDALKGPHMQDYDRAINTLAALHSTKALSALHEITFQRGNKDSRGRWMAVRALGIIGDQTAVPDLIHLLYYNNVNTRWWAQISLVQLTGQNFGKDWKAWGNWWNSKNGRPPFNPEVIRWWDGQAEPDELMASFAGSDQKFIESIEGKGPPIKDAFWQKLDRSNYQRYSEELKKAPHVLVVRPTHFSLTQSGIGFHWGWIDGKMANLCVSFSELVSYAYSQQAVWNSSLMVRTELPPDWYEGRLTNRFDVIDTLQVHPLERLQAEIKRQIKQQFGLAWHREIRDTEVFLIKVKDPQVLASKVRHVAGSRSLPELAEEWENYFGKPVLDETGLTNRYDGKLDLIPAAYVPKRTKDLEANNAFLGQYGLELVPTNQPMEWLAMERIKNDKPLSQNNETNQEPEDTLTNQ
ncbi:MAG: protein kinase [Verrucomicrobiota bacterium]